MLKNDDRRSGKEISLDPKDIGKILEMMKKSGVTPEKYLKWMMKNYPEH